MKHYHYFFIILNIFIYCCTIPQKVTGMIPTIKNYKVSLATTAVTQAALMYQAFDIYKKEIKKHKKSKDPVTFFAFLKKYPSIYTTALFNRDRIFVHKNPYFCTATKIITVATPVLFTLENYNNAQLNKKKKAQSDKQKLEEKLQNDKRELEEKLQKQMIENTNANVKLLNENYHPSNIPKYVHNHPFSVNRPVILFQNTTIAQTYLPQDTNLQLLTQRKKEEQNLTPGTVLIEQSHPCLFCHEKFKDRESAYFYGCNTTHLYHEQCITTWEAHDNNGYFHGTPIPGRAYPNPHGCHNECNKGNEGDKNNRPNIIKVTVKLRQQPKPGHHEYAKVINGIITDPCDETGNLLRVCNVCNKYFKNNDPVAFANHHPDCNTNHIVHQECMHTFRDVQDGGNVKRGHCWIHRGIACPYRCTDPKCPPRNARTIDPEPVNATVFFTDGNPEQQSSALQILKTKTVETKNLLFRYNCTNEKCALNTLESPESSYSGNKNYKYNTTYNSYGIDCEQCGQFSKQEQIFITKLTCNACNKTFENTHKDCVWMECKDCKEDFQWCISCLTEVNLGCSSCGKKFTNEQLTTAKVYRTADF